MSLLVKRSGLENTKKKMSHMVGKQEGKSGMGWLPQSQANFNEMVGNIFYRIKVCM